MESPRNMHLWKNSLLLVALVAAAGICLAQSASDLESKEVKRVAAKLNCSCGCKQSMACDMPGPCGTCRTNRTKIYKMQSAGLSDSQIVDKFVQEDGKDVLLIEPGTMGFVVPYIALAAGLAVLWWFIKRSRKPVAADGPSIEPETLSRYHEQIEKEVEKLE